MISTCMGRVRGTPMSSNPEFSGQKAVGGYLCVSRERGHGGAFVVYGSWLAYSSGPQQCLLSIAPVFSSRFMVISGLVLWPARS